MSNVRTRLNCMIAELGALSFTGATLDDVRAYISLCNAAPEFDTPDNVLNAYEHRAKTLLRKLYAVQHGPERAETAAIRNWLVAVIGEVAFDFTDEKAVRRYQELRAFYGPQVIAAWKPQLETTTV